MSTENKNTLADDAETAVQLEAEAQTEPDTYAYTHTFKRPFVYNGVTVKELTFDWGALTGNDHLAIENELLKHGKTLVLPEYTGDFLCGMAVRACTNRDGNGIRLLDNKAMKSMPIRDFQTICKKARSFLLRAGS